MIKSIDEPPTVLVLLPGQATVIEVRRLQHSTGLPVLEDAVHIWLHLTLFLMWVCTQSSSWSESSAIARYAA